MDCEGAGTDGEVLEVGVADCFDVGFQDRLLLGLLVGFN